MKLQSNSYDKEDASVTGSTKKYKKIIFWMILGGAVLMVYAYNYLTPYLSDDYAYLIEVRKASSLWDLIKQQYGEYLSNSGRIIGQFNVRLSLSVDKQIFNVVNSGMFLALILLIYYNIRRRREYDIFVLLTILVFVWRFTVDFGQTMLWICGSCNYLWGSVIILAYFSLYRYILEHAQEMKHQAALAAAMFFLGIPAGWCNENTSGGGLLLVLMYGTLFAYRRKKENQKAVYPFMVTGAVGICCGIFGMIMAPGVRKRSAVMSEDAYTGIVGLLSRTYKITVTVRELFFLLLAIMTVVLLLLILQNRKKEDADRKCDSFLFLIAFAATCYALALAPTPANRAFFGAGVFLITGCIQGIVDVREEEISIRAAKYGLTGILCLWLFFTYVENLVNLARIYREDQERIALIMEEKEDPDCDGIVVIPKYREAFRNVYSTAHDSDLTDDKEYWINNFYEVYYDVGNITAIPRDEWNERYGNEK